jgi:hypothetical protein
MDRDEREAMVLEYLAKQDDYVTSAVIAGDLGVNRNTLLTLLTRMASEGRIVSRQPAKGGGFRLPPSSEEQTPAPDPPQAPAPDPPREHPADEAPVPDPQPVPPWPASFAGELLEAGAPIDEEIGALDVCVERIGRLDDDARCRVMIYLASRFGARE